MTYLLFIVGFYALIKGADTMIDAASEFAKHFHISPLVIGLTIVAFGTSAPELLVSLLASLNGHNDLAIGNIIGSNTSNILLILGVSAFFATLSIKKQTLFKEIPFAILAIVILSIFTNDVIINGANENILSKSEGIALLSFFSIFIYYSFSNTKESEIDNEKPKNSLIISVVLFFIGAIALALGGHWIVDGAILIASNFGISESLIGLTIIAVGTSLPELATSIIAAKSGKSDLAMGNIIGSNIFNVFFVLGINATVQSMPFQDKLNTDIFFSIFSIVLLFIFILFSAKQKIQKWHGVIFLICYILYIISLIIRG